MKPGSKPEPPGLAAGPAPARSSGLGGLAAAWHAHRMAWLVGGVLALLALALWNPGWPGRRSVQELIVVFDITQSMGAQDQWLPDERGVLHAATRLQVARAALVRALDDLPCGTRLGLGVFTEHRSFVLMAPVEVCGAYSELRASIARIDHRMAWTGNSEVAKGLDSALRLLHAQPTHPALVFVTDGHEAPPVHPQFRPGFHTDRGAVKGVLVGVGGEALVPIPLIDPRGRVMGQWAAKDVMQVDSRTAARNASPGDHSAEGWQGSATMPGATPGREHLTSLKDEYLHLLADETGLAYLRLRDGAGLARALMAPQLSHDEAAAVPLRRPLALAALLLLAWLYRPQVLLARALQLWRLRRAAMPAPRREANPPGDGQPGAAPPWAAMRPQR